MNRKIKLIWDFRGPTAQKTAEHHAIHLKEYAQIENLQVYGVETETFSEFVSIAFMIVDEKDMISVRDALKPHRGEVAQ